MRVKLYRWVLFKLLGWRIEGELPTNLPKILFVGAPHTSNWDFLYCWLAIRSLDLDVTIFIKDIFFFWPLRYVCRYFGLAPVNRRKSTNFVDSIAKQFTEYDELYVVIAPEGTRKLQTKLKSGYYYIAKIADVPIVVAGPNYKDKIVAFQPARKALATFEEDQASIIEFCKSMYGKQPDNSFR